MHLAFSLQLKRVGRRARAGMERTNLRKRIRALGLSRESEYTGFMATFATIPAEEYLRTTYAPDMEYVDGQLVERKVGEYLHSRLQCLIALALGLRERERRFRCSPN